jgi:hypothetical protein
VFVRRDRTGLLQPRLRFSTAAFVKQRDLKMAVFRGETLSPIGECAAEVPIVRSVITCKEALIGLVRLLARSAARDATPQWDQVD